MPGHCVNCPVSLATAGKLWVLLSLVACPASALNVEADAVAHSAQRGFIQMTLHFPDVDYGKIKADPAGLQALKASIVSTLEESIKTTSASIKNQTEVRTVKAVVTDVAVADPEYDYDDDEHDYDDRTNRPSHNPGHRYPLDNLSTVVLARASMSGVHDLLILKTFRVLLVSTPELVWLEAFAKDWGVPECLVATVHVDTSFSSTDHVSLQDGSEPGPAGDTALPDLQAGGVAADAASELRRVDWALVACGALVAILASAAVLGTVFLSTARHVPAAYAMLDAEDAFSGPAPEL